MYHFWTHFCIFIWSVIFGVVGFFGAIALVVALAHEGAAAYTAIKKARHPENEENNS